MDRLLSLEQVLISSKEYAISIFSTKGKVAVVTGSLSGIGLGIANSLAKRGYNIILNGLTNSKDLEKVQTHFRNTYPNIKAVYVYADLTRALDCRLLIEKTMEEFGRVDVLVNNAGMQHIDEIANFPEHKWQDILALNLSSSFYLTKYALPSMLKNGWGRIINIASVHGLVASVNKSAYVAAKHGLVGFTKATALQYAKKGITCNVVCPGWVFTPLIQKQIQLISQRDKVSFEDASKKLVQQKQPSGKFSTVDDIGQIVGFLVSDNAKQVNGASWTIDGGWTAQ